ncbi:hypothetical protein [Microbacterium azadirachtae]|uniref:Uncharacterized protein n=1 Tax=Microbacterium azadirachtae TaxID=582680 RepID=A0A0F0LKQ6_9MICO|nr:hypothetical protein [Microbacterium azadirachtae]KJL33718.1 hypothetical protein RS86_01515 [Microbacterium azadirachtae]
MGYRIRAGSTSSTWSSAILLLVAALIAGLLGMHVLAGHGSPSAGAEPGSHAAMAGAAVSAIAVEPVSAMAGAAVPAMAAETGVLATAADHDAAAGPGHGCADCAEHAAMAEACVLAPVVPVALPGPPAEDLRPVLAAGVAASPANDPADPRPPSIAELCISRR